MRDARAPQTQKIVSSLCALKLVRLPLSLAATLTAFTLITRTAPCLRQLPSCVDVYPRDTRSRRVLSRNPFPRFVVKVIAPSVEQGNALSVMLTVSQLSKSSLLLEVRFGASGIRRVVASNRSESRWSDLDSALGRASLARATFGHGRPFPNALCTDNLQSSDRYR